MYSIEGLAGFGGFPKIRKIQIGVSATRVFEVEIVDSLQSCFDHTRLKWLAPLVSRGSLY